MLSNLPLLAMAALVVVLTMVVLWTLWRIERDKRRETETRLAATREDLALTRQREAAQVETREEYREQAERIQADTATAEQTILSASEDDDAPLAGVLTDTLERHRRRASGASGSSDDSGNSAEGDA